MMEKFLKSRLQPVIRRQQWQAVNWRLAAAWAAVAFVAGAFLLWHRQTGWASPLTMPILAAVGLVAAMMVIARQFERRPDYREIAQKIEQRHPELKGLLLTAVQQDLPEGASPGYLQYRVLQEAMERSRASDWRRIVPAGRLWLATLTQFAMLALLLLALSHLRTGVSHPADGLPAVPFSGVAVTPGDIDLERGESLVVLARFGGALPANVEMVVRTSGESPRKVALVKSLADPVFGGSVPEVKTDLVYHLEYGGKSTRDYKVTVFEHPRLERADAELTFPAYTAQEPKRIENTRRISAVEGTRLDLSLQLNKPVASAKLVAHDAKKTVIPLQVSAEKAVASLPKFALAASQTYDLQLVDAQGRTNKTASPFVIDVLPNKPPELHVNSPRGDVRPSALEEITFDGTVWDDFGSPAYGLSYTVAGGETKTIELGRAVPAKEKRPFNYTLRLEDLGVQPDQLLSWYVWADDVGPDGKVRRTNGDLFFAEVRPFEEVFRESQQQQSQDQQQQGQQGQGNQNRRLTELEKQIINATWKLQRDPSGPKYSDDAGVVRDSQQDALSQAGASQQKSEDPRAKALWTAVTQQMEQASSQLKDAVKSPAPLTKALTSEQAAYQALLKLQARETQVSRSRGRGQGGGGQQANQRQLDQLDLTQQENRYETQRQATPPQSPERREQLQVMNRLQELARRQQDVNDRLKELQTALQEAKTEQQREDVRRQLKRLQEEQQQLLADADEVQQRMNRPENQSQMNDQRQQMDQTRSELQRAADAAGQGSVAQALSAGTRAQRQLQDMRDELRKQSSSQFADDLREMRNEARDLATQEEAIAQKLGNADAGQQRKSLSDTPDRQGLVDQLDKQKERMKDLVDRAKQVSEQAENSEPLLAEKLYDSLRKLDQDDDATAKEFQQELLRNGLLTRSLNDRLDDKSGPAGAKSLDLTAEMLREGYLPQATEAEQRARAGINNLKDGVERAAESILGDDTSALQIAQSELDAVTDQLMREAAQAQGRPAPGDPAQQQKGAQPGQAGQAGQQQASAGERPDGQGQPGEAGADAQAQPGSATEQAQRLADARQGRGQTSRQPGQPGQRGQNGQRGQQPSEGQASAQGQDGQQGQGQGDRQVADANAQQGQGAQGAQGQAGQAGGQRGGAQRGGQRLAGADNRGGAQAGGGGGQLGIDNFIGGGLGGYNGGPVNVGGPLLGDNFGAWADRLRDVEEMVDSPEMQQAVAAARERARLMRLEYKRDLKKPDWAVVQLEIVKPLVEVRNRISDELARRGSKDSLVPIDRDPVPNRFAESVRKYYEELGKDN
ncbi:MAG TPA: hypothetical protein VG838_15630 [Opitutaceae bacterium]|nr:hypothetical protein [Opitutaceae bacterium]